MGHGFRYGYDFAPITKGKDWQWPCMPFGCQTSRTVGAHIGNSWTTDFTAWVFLHFFPVFSCAKQKFRIKKSYKLNNTLVYRMSSHVIRRTSTIVLTGIIMADSAYLSNGVVERKGKQKIEQNFSFLFFRFPLVFTNRMHFNCSFCTFSRNYHAWYFTLTFGCLFLFTFLLPVFDR